VLGRHSAREDAGHNQLIEILPSNLTVVYCKTVFCIEYAICFDPIGLSSGLPFITIYFLLQNCSYFYNLYHIRLSVPLAAVKVSRSMVLFLIGPFDVDSFVAGTVNGLTALRSAPRCPSQNLPLMLCLWSGSSRIYLCHYLPSSHLARWLS